MATFVNKIKDSDKCSLLISHMLFFTLFTAFTLPPMLLTSLIFL